MTDHIHLVGFSGSLRKASYNTMLLHSLSELLPENVSFEIASIEMPLYNADNDLPTAAERPAQVESFRTMLAKADGMVIVSPEYNFSIPGCLKNAIDWASRGDDSPLKNKPVAIMGATPGMWGTVKMQIAFLPVFQFLNITPVPMPEVLINQADKKFNENGSLIDQTTRDIVKKKLQALKELVVQLKK